MPRSYRRGLSRAEQGFRPGQRDREPGTVAERAAERQLASRIIETREARVSERYYARIGASLWHFGDFAGLKGAGQSPYVPGMSEAGAESVERNERSRRMYRDLRAIAELRANGIEVETRQRKRQRTDGTPRKRPAVKRTTERDPVLPGARIDRAATERRIVGPAMIGDD